MERTKVYIAVLFAALSLSLNAMSQKFSIHSITNSLCPSDYKAYGNFLIRLEKLGGNRNDVSVFNLISDSIYISKLTDSTYLLCPMYENVLCKIFIIDNRQFNVVDSISLKIGHSAFSLKITLLNVVHGTYTFQEILSKTERLFFYASDMSCYTIKQKPILISYSLCLKRGDSIKAIINLKGDQRIPKSFKQEILKIYEQGDEFCARNIFFSNEIGIIFQQSYEPLYLFR